MSQILVTGAAGFIGYHLSKHLLNAGHEVTLVDNFKRGRKDKELDKLLAHKNAKFLQMDLTDMDQVNALPYYSKIYHLAAINGTGNFYSIPDQVLRVNIMTTLNLLEWAKDKKDVKIVYTSSSEAYAGTIQSNPSLVPTAEDVPLCIDDVTNVRWSYGASKLLGECAMFAYGSKYPVEFSVVRYHNIYGARMGFDHVLPQFLRRIHSGESPLKVYGTTQTRAFCYITDAVKATQMVMDHDKSDKQIYHIGNQDEEIKISDLAVKLLGILHKPQEILPMDPPDGSVTRRCPDTTKLSRLGYKPTVNLDQGLSEMAEWYMSYFNAPEN
jgi:nucleoside-diphosphate-sugar epimerase